jgi:hypothetical protein
MLTYRCLDTLNIYILWKMLDLQHQYNNPSHEGGSYILEPTLM